MIILSNSLTEKADEGCLKVASSLIKRIKEEQPETTVISYGKENSCADLYLPVNKWMLHPKLLGILWKRKEPLLYVPAVARAHTMAIRVLILSLFAREGLQVVQVMQYRTGKFARLLLKASKAQLILFSRESWQYYAAILGDRARYLQTGVDTHRFCPVPDDRKRELRRRYGLPEDKIIVLHVGHMRAGRNVEKLMLLDHRTHGVLVTSTYAAQTQDEDLRQKLMNHPNMTVMDSYLPNIEQIYQLADVYLFPVVAVHNCIDVPLSAMEAAACNLPVVTTPYGEMKELLGKDGFYEIKSFEPEYLNSLICTAVEEKLEPRPHVLKYDWDLAVETILKSIQN